MRKVIKRMNNLEKYNKVFLDVFGVKKEKLEELSYQGIEAWDSVGHMALITTLENEFGIMIDTMDVIDFNSYTKGKEILRKPEYGIF